MTSPTTDNLTLDTVLGVRNIVEENKQTVIREGGEVEVIVETRESKQVGSNKMGTDNGAMENETPSEINICRAVEEDDLCALRDPHDEKEEEISDAESSKDSKDVQTSDSGQSMDGCQDSDSFVSVKAQLSAEEIVSGGGGHALSSESNLDLLSLD